MFLKNKKIWPSLMGNVLEFYDLGLYGFYASLLYIKFFPGSDPLTKILASSGIFAAGFVMRPLGAVIFGYIGDIYGRSKVLLMTLFLTALSSVFIGILPSYESIGIYASILLTFFRLLQGICTGGEYNTAAIFVLENTSEKRRGFLSGIITSTAIMGFFFASSMAYLTSLDFMPEWSWRLPFILGGAAAIAGYKIRRLSYKNDLLFNGQKNSGIPLFKVFKENKRTLLSTIGVGWLAGCLSLMIVGFIKTYLISIIGIPAPLASQISHFGLFVYMISLPIYGHISDSMGHKELMEKAAFFAILSSLPVFVLFSSGESLNIVIAVTILSLTAGAFLSSMHAYMLSAFPPEQRCSGISFCFSVGVALFGGTVPLISTLLIEWTHLPYAPAFYIILSATVGLLSLNWKASTEKIEFNISSENSNKKAAIMRSAYEQ